MVHLVAQMKAMPNRQHAVLVMINQNHQLVVQATIHNQNHQHADRHAVATASNLYKCPGTFFRGRDILL